MHPLLLASVVAVAALASGCRVQPVPVEVPVLPLPPRARSAPSGTAFAREVRAVPLAEREQRVESEVLAGNVPAALRELEPITVAATLDGRVRTLVYLVAPDYLAIGNDADFVRVPLTAPAAQRIADRVGCVLPTRKMVDDIYRAATLKLTPRTFHPDQHEIQSVEVFEANHRATEAERAGRSGMVAGVKKDLVVSPLIATAPDRVVIYGWHRLDGRPIQPIWNRHALSYVDYSHGVRLVWRTVYVDGEPRELATVLADPVLWPLVSDEGPFGSWRYATGSR